MCLGAFDEIVEMLEERFGELKGRTEDSSLSELSSKGLL